MTRGRLVLLCMAGLSFGAWLGLAGNGQAGHKETPPPVAHIDAHPAVACLRSGRVVLGLDACLG